MKIFFRRIHLYLSLAAGIPILIACLTGALLVFEKDLEKAFNEDRYFVQPQGKAQTIEQLAAHAVKTFPGNKVSGVKMYTEANRSVELTLSPAQKAGAGKQPEGATKGGAENGRGKPQAGRGHGGPQPGFTVFVNPYSGEVLGKYNYRETFFFQVMALHRWLLGGNDSIGKIIMGVSTFIFLFILITGIVLWWPRNRAILLKRLKIKNNAGFKRLNHDLHIVLGFYSAILLFIFAFTAMSWSFEWFNKSLYAVTKSSPQPPEAPKSVPSVQPGIAGIDAVLRSAAGIYPGAAFYQISIPKDSTESFAVSALLPGAPHENATSSVYIDQFSGEVIGRLPFAERSAGQRARSFIRPIHTGSIWGMPSKIIAFVVCMLGASFPITGFIMWRNRTRKKNNRLVKKQAAATVV